MGNHSNPAHCAQGNRPPLDSKEFLLPLLWGALLNLLVGALPSYNLYLNNMTRISFSSVRSAMLLSAGLALALFLVLAFVTRKPAWAAVFSAAVMFIALDFSTLRTLCDNLFGSRAATACALVLGVLILVALALLLRLLRNQQGVLSTFTLILLIVIVCFTGLNTFNGVKAYRAKLASDQATAAAVQEEYALQASPAAEPEATATAEPSPTEEPFEFDLSTGKPNVYWFIIDEMGGFTEMSQYYDYDPSDFQAFLTEHNCNYSSTSYSSSKETFCALADVMYLDYISGDMNSAVVWYTFQPPQKTLMYQILDKRGYGVYRMSSKTEMFYGLTNLTTDTNANTYLQKTTEDGLTAEEVVKENSILAWLQRNKTESSNANVGDTLLSTEEIMAGDGFRGLGSYYGNNAAAILRTFDYFTQEENYAHEAPAAIIIYLPTTHVPFVFWSDGSIHASDYHNWADPDIYMGCYEFTVAELERVISGITEYDPDSVIVIQSDHGVRYHDEISEVQPFVISTEDELNVMNIVYYRGQKLNIEGLTPTNTWRAVMTLLGEDYPLLDGRSMDDVLGK